MVCPVSSPPLDPQAASSAGGPADLDGTLRAALIESRQRMKELLELSCNFAWETDANGLFSFVTAGGALGHETLDLLGSDPVDLLLSPEDGAAFPGRFAPRGPAGLGQHQGRRAVLPASQGPCDLRRAGRVPLRARRLPRRDRRNRTATSPWRRPATASAP